MHHLNRLARRALIPVAARRATVTDAAGTRPKVTVRVKQRTLVVEGGRADETIWVYSPAATPFNVVVALGVEGQVVATVHRDRFDSVVIRSGDGDDSILVNETAGESVPFTDTKPTSILAGEAGITRIQGPSTAVTLVDMNPLDALSIFSVKGADTIDATGVAADTARLALITGPGSDLVLGGAGADVVLAGPGRDVVDANKGDDNISLDDGDDEIIWDPGDGSDLVDGANGYDVMTFNGAGGDEVMAASAIDLSGTTISTVDVNLAGAPGTVGGDGAVDRIVVTGTPGDDVITAFGAAGAARIDDLAWTIDLVNSESTDALTIDGNGGEDIVDTTGLGPDTIQPALP